MQVETHIQGIPCLAEVTTFARVKPWRGDPSNCPSSADYYGYIDVEFSILDRKGYKAAWLEHKLTDQDIERIKQDIFSAYTIEE